MGLGPGIPPGETSDTMRQTVSRHVQLLNGIWDIAPGTFEAPTGQWGARIPVPSLVDCAAPPYEWWSFPFHWYHIGFRVDADSPRETATIRIGQAMFGTSVWLNGNHLGGTPGRRAGRRGPTPQPR